MDKDKCPHCSKEVFKHDLTEYCMYCGKKININTCKNESCVIFKEEVMLPDDARYCPVCGKSTIYADEIPF